MECHILIQYYLTPITYPNIYYEKPITNDVTNKITQKNVLTFGGHEMDVQFEKIESYYTTK